jgi:hypothetical protein
MVRLCVCEVTLLVLDYYSAFRSLEVADAAESVFAIHLACHHVPMQKIVDVPDDIPSGTTTCDRRLSEEVPERCIFRSKVA